MTGQWAGQGQYAVAVGRRQYAGADTYWLLLRKTFGMRDHAAKHPSNFFITLAPS